MLKKIENLIERSELAKIIAVLIAIAGFGVVMAVIVFLALAPAFFVLQFLFGLFGVN